MIDDWCHFSFSLLPSSRRIVACTNICCTSSKESSFVRRSIHQHRILTLYAPPPIPHSLSLKLQPQQICARDLQLAPGATLPQASATGGEPHHQAMPRATEAFGASRSSLDKRCPRDSGRRPRQQKGLFAGKPPMSSRTHAPKAPTCLHPTLR